ERTHVLRNGHVVVVEHDEQIGRQRSGVVQGLERQAGRDRAIADHGHHAAALTSLRGRHGHAERSADRGARMTDTERVVLALCARRKGCKPTGLLDRVKLLASPREHLVWISLVAYIPDKPVVRRVEHIMQGYRQFDSAETGGEMPTTGTDALDEKVAQ